VETWKGKNGWGDAGNCDFDSIENFAFQGKLIFVSFLKKNQIPGKA
jgi:hypothetical protein